MLGTSPEAAPTPRRKVSKKVVLLGHFGVGKSSLLKRFVHQKFSSKYHSTIGVKIDRKKVALEDTDLSMILWDIEGGPDQSTWPQSYFRGGHGVIYVFDWTRPDTYMNLQRDLDRVREIVPGAALLSIGNKVDCLTAEQQTRLLLGASIPFDLASSAKTGENVEHAFQRLAELML